MSTAGGAAVSMAVLTVAGALPVVTVAGRRWASVLLAPLAGAVVAALSAAGLLVLGGPLAAWFVGLSLGANALAALWWVTGRAGQARRARGGDRSGPARTVAGAGWPDAGAAAAVVVAVVACLTSLRAPTVGFDARTIWMLHGVWFAHGRPVALAALRSPALPFAHATYPPLLGATAAVSWWITGHDSYRLGVVMVALLNGCAVGAAALTVVEAGRRTRSAVPPGRRFRHGPWLMTTLVGVLLVGVAFGVAGPFATNGYADLLWSASVVAAVGFGLVLPGRATDLGAAAVLLAVAGLTKDEGAATAAVVVALITARVVGRRWRAGGGSVSGRGRSPTLVPPLVAGALGVAALAGWPLLVRLLGAAPNVATLGTRTGSDLSSAGDALRAALPHLHVVALAVPVAVGGALVLGGTRRAMGLGNDGWAWTVLVVGTLVVVATYATGGGNLALWLVTSIHRTTFFPALVAWWVIGVWAVVGAVRLCSDGGPSGSAGRAGAGDLSGSAGRGGLGLLGEAEDPLSHDVALDLRRPPPDRLRP